jgi:hypothetical protein
VIALYAFTLELDDLPQIDGIDGATLIRLDLDELTAVGSRHAAPPLGEPRAQALAQGLVVEALTALSAAVLPVRFGETFADERALAEAVRERADELHRALELVRGCAEIGVCISGSDDEPPAAQAESGTAYMRARLADETCVGALHERLTPVARATTTPRGGEAAYLVERPRVAVVMQRVEDFAASHPELSVSCTGPWAPYSFGSTP